MRTRRSITGLAALVAAGSILAMGPAVQLAGAHVGVSATSPRAGAILQRVPRTVSVTFTGEILEGTIVVRKAGVVVSKGTGRKDPTNARRVRVAMKSGLGKGTYVVRWTVTSPDGHHQHGSFRFRVT